MPWLLRTWPAPEAAQQAGEPASEAASGRGRSGRAAMSGRDRAGVRPGPCPGRTWPRRSEPPAGCEDAAPS